jgi:O-antigen/teichoic acid export membrane protein
MSAATLEKEPCSINQLELGSRLSGLPWVKKGSLAIVDQALISGSNFLIGILLARWLPPDQYGAYALAFSTFLLLSLAYQSLLLEPQSVFGSSAYLDSPRQYLGALLWAHGALALAIFIILGISAGAAHELGGPGNFSGALAGVAFAAPCILLFWLARGACYVRQAPQHAAAGALLYSVLVLGGLLVLFPRGLLSPFTAFVLMGLGALATSTVLLIRLNPTLKLGRDNPTLSRVAQQHWIYGRWALASSVMTWIPWNIHYALLGHFSGMAAAGGLRALVNLMLPLAQSCNALSLLITPYASRTHAQGGAASLDGLSWRITSLFVGGGVAYWAVIILLRASALRFLYDGRYGALAHLVPWVAIASVLWTAVYGPAIVLRAKQAPALVFCAYSASAAIALVTAAPASRAFGLQGTVWAIILSSAVGLAVALFLVHRGVPRALKA